MVVEGDSQHEQHAPPRNQQQAPPREVAHGPVSRHSPDDDIALICESRPCNSRQNPRVRTRFLDPADLQHDVDNASPPPSMIARELVAHQGLELRFGNVLDSRHWSNHDALRTRLQSVEFNADEVTHHYEMATSAQVRSYLHDHLGSHRQSVAFSMPKYPSKDTEASSRSGVLAQLFDSLVWESVRQHLGHIDDLYLVGHQLHGVRGNTTYPLPIVAAHVWSHFRQHLDPSGLPSTTTAQAAVIPSTSSKSTSVFADFALFGLMAATCAIGNAPLPYLHPILIQFVSGNYGVIEVVDAAIELGSVLELLPDKVGKAYSRLCRVRVSMYPTARDMGHALEVADFELFGERAEQVKHDFISELKEVAAAGMAGPTVRQSVARRYVAFMLHHYLAPLDAFRRGLRLGLQCDHGPTSFRNNLVVALFPTDTFMVTASSVIRQLQQGSASDGLDPIAGWLMLGELRGWLAVAEEYARSLLVLFTTFVFGSYLIPPATEGGVRVAVHVKKKKKSEEAHVSFSTDPPAVTFHVGAATHDWGQLRGEAFHLLMTQSLYERAEKLRSRSREEASRISTISMFAEQLQQQDTLWKDWVPGDSIGYTW
ncbi:hypothetical protein BCR44DRAFT_1440268 [Catenaria anguillulae PL171]|uniref:Uncharacterized protein n=2 Tax=Catenaria anguillulae PL171 TaxID=765915 RepID=A0A1Y2HD13_9FUNG|nr:hypothetical protein BCR44DRAFT_1446469 [Catenaria anguillulae PL171]ORZ32466.1 hypothetical protein BCR44DRAFT_1440268 [Catenaria anguillulae PL171]